MTSGKIITDPFDASLCHNALEKQATKQSKWQPESQPESLGDRVQLLLNNGALSKSELSERLGQKEVSGQLNMVVRKLLDDKYIELTIPNKPKSRLQKYRLTKKGIEYLKKKYNNK